jgi:hypothetical protein
MSRLRLYTAAGILAALLCGIVACSGFWNTAPKLGTLVIAG